MAAAKPPSRVSNGQYLTIGQSTQVELADDEWNDLLQPEHSIHVRDLCGIAPPLHVRIASARSIFEWSLLSLDWSNREALGNAIAWRSQSPFFLRMASNQGSFLRSLSGIRNSIRRSRQWHGRRHLICWLAMNSNENAYPREGESALSAYAAAGVRFLGNAGLWWTICLTCAAILAWSGRHAMNPDGMSYLDLASAASASGPSHLLNGYWSPGYPAVLAVARWLSHPSADQEFPLVHLVNFIIFGLALWSFSALFKAWSLAAFGKLDESSRGIVTAFGYGTFLWFTTTFITLENVSPDMAVAAIVLLAASIVFRLSAIGSHLDWKHYALLGAVLAVGYYVKAAMFPLGLCLIALLFALPFRLSGVSRTKMLISLAVFLGSASPLVIALSIRAHHPTFGETSRLNFLWYANGLRWNGAEEPLDPTAVADHPAPKLLTKPTTLVFAAPIEGTYPIWFDPTYWYADVKTRLDLRSLFRPLPANIRELKDELLTARAYLCGAIVLTLVLIGSLLRGVAWRNIAWQCAWPMAAFLVYLPVHLEVRFVAAFCILAVLAVYGEFFVQDRRIAGAVAATVLLTSLLPTANSLGNSAGQLLRHPLRPMYQIEGNALTNMGFSPGDRIAIVGYAHGAYYARYAGLRIVAQIPDAREFWQLDREALKTLEDRLSAIGVRGIVAVAPTGQDLDIPQWRSLSEVRRVMLLPVQAP